MSVLEQIKELVQNSKSILILTHENPDGDAIGSSLGFMNGLKKAGKKVDVMIPKINDMYSYLPGFDLLKTQVKAEDYDLCIALDSSDLERLRRRQSII